MQGGQVSSPSFLLRQNADVFWRSGDFPWDAVDWGSFLYCVRCIPTYEIINHTDSTCGSEWPTSAW